MAIPSIIKNVLITVLFLLYLNPDAFSLDQYSDLEVIISGVKNSKGKLRIALCSSEEQYYSDRDLYTTASIEPSRGINEFTFENVPYGVYAIKAYHDKNDNDKLDKGLFGIPREKYGFSNDPEIKGGMPEFDETSFAVASPRTTEKIRMN